MKGDIGSRLPTKPVEEVINLRSYIREVIVAFYVTCAVNPAINTILIHSSCQNPSDFGRSNRPRPIQGKRRKEEGGDGGRFEVHKRCSQEKRPVPRSTRRRCHL